MNFAAHMTFSFITLFHVLLVSFFIILYIYKTHNINIYIKHNKNTQFIKLNKNIQNMNHTMYIYIYYIYII